MNDGRRRGQKKKKTDIVTGIAAKVPPRILHCRRYAHYYNIITPPDSSNLYCRYGILRNGPAVATDFSRRVYRVAFGADDSLFYR